MQVENQSAEIAERELAARKKRTDVLKLCRLILQRVLKTVQALIKWVPEKADRLTNFITDNAGKSVPIALILNEVLSHFKMNLEQIIELIKKATH